MNDYFKSRLKVLKYQSSLFKMFGYNVQKKTTVYTCPCCNEFKSGNAFFENQASGGDHHDRQQQITKRHA